MHLYDMSYRTFTKNLLYDILKNLLYEIFQIYKIIIYGSYIGHIIPHI